MALNMSYFKYVTLVYNIVLSDAVKWTLDTKKCYHNIQCDCSIPVKYCNSTNNYFSLSQA